MGWSLTPSARDEATQTRERMEKVGSNIEQIRDVQLSMGSFVQELREVHIFDTISAGRPLEVGEKKGRLAKRLWGSICLLEESSVIATLRNKAASAQVLGQLREPEPEVENFVSPSLGAHKPGSQPDKIAERLLGELAFQGMSDREDRISTPFPDTFSWLLDDCISASPTCFKEWLCSQKHHSPFWITGKPASGKSTLMKFIATHPDLVGMLREWSDPLGLLVASVYFWGPGSSIQRSEEGLLRSVLFQLLRQRPHLWPLVSPRRYLLHSLLGEELSKPPPWELAELRRCVARLAAEVGKTDRIALFIDGLDEYDGRAEDLVAFLCDLHKAHRLKLCVSSRPWNVFADAFRTSPSLRMQDLTRDDIRIYVDHRLQSSAGFGELRVLYPKEISQLRLDIENKAQGVFLWVVLVVEQILLVVQDHPRLEAIWQTFHGLPEGLESLYTAIQASLGKSQRQTAAKLYQIAYEWKRVWNPRINAIVLWLAVDAHDGTSLQYPEWGVEKHIYPVLSRLLAGSTKGLLQLSTSSISQEPEVEFLHRTAYDWMRMDENWTKIVADQPAGFNATLSIIMALVCQFQSTPPKTDPSAIGRAADEWLRIFMFASRVDNTRHNRARLIRIIDQVDPQFAWEKRGFRIDPHLNPEYVCPPTDCNIWSGHELAAAGWSCLPYLEGKMEAGNSPWMRSTRRGSRRLSHIFKQLPVTGSDRPEAGFLLYIAAKGREAVHIQPSTQSWNQLEYEGHGPWLIPQRLDTVHLLLRAGLRVDGKRMKRQFKLAFPTTEQDVPPWDSPSEVGGGELQFRFILWKLLNDFSSADYSALKKRYLPPDLAEDSYSGMEFPELNIGF